jgi:hypothetical protein
MTSAMAAHIAAAVAAWWSGWLVMRVFGEGQQVVGMNPTARAVALQVIRVCAASRDHDRPGG